MMIDGFAHAGHLHSTEESYTLDLSVLPYVVGFVLVVGILIVTVYRIRSHRS